MGIALLLFPVLKTHNETLAVGFLGFRMIAALLVIAGTIILLLILRVSQKYVKDNASTKANKTTGDKLKTARDFVNHVAMIIILCISSLMLYTVTLQSGLIPVWLSVWGIAGAAIAMLASILVWLKYVKIISPGYMLLNLPPCFAGICFCSVVNMERI
ncbi:MAG: DUF4386 domain-containing protein [Bacteroidales bacterium]|nr:DUF4386 domain-containing protein [Bacteroidales bacterium]